MTKGKVLSRARQWRLEYQVKIGQSVSIREVAEAIGEDRRAVMRIENNDVQRADMDVLTKLSAFYHEAGVDTRIVMEYDPNGIQASSLTPAFGTGR